MKKLTILSILVAVFLTSCYNSKKSTNSYINNVPNINMFENKGDYQVSGQVGNNHEEMQIGCAVDSHISVSGSIYTGAGGQEYWDASIGYWGKSGEEGDFYYDISAGYGEGKIFSRGYDVRAVNSYSKMFIDRDISYKRIFIQPGFYFSGPNRKSKLGFAVRISSLQFNNYQYRILRDNGHEILNQQATNFSGTAIESILMYTTNYRKFLDFTFQLVSAQRTANGIDLWNHADYDPIRLHINTGVRINLGYLMQL